MYVVNAHGSQNMDRRNFCIYVLPMDKIYDNGCSLEEKTKQECKSAQTHTPHCIYHEQNKKQNLLIRQQQETLLEALESSKTKQKQKQE